MAVKTIPVEEYAQPILADKVSVTTAEMTFEGDFDFVMSMLLLMYYDEDSSFYALQLHEGEVTRGRYTIPNMTISRRL